ncbi:MAG: histidine--tRNA ligase [Deltaproteobacteria bacterium]|nr:histidine--tRNA ligase [Deltaproteobacteria bacterium]MBI4224294.1 histidine--tRNA ligase [Deltaproteobacteria bacterium]
MKIQVIKGMRDILPPETAAWEAVENKARQIFKTYGFEEIRTPIVEEAGLFERSVGATSAIVEKEMYAFKDRKGLPLALRPEGTAPVVRAYVEAGFYAKDPVAKLYYFGPMFRYESPQKGRSRQFFQIGAELIGSDSPMADAEVLILLDHLFSELGLKDRRLEINSLGCVTCRPAYLTAIKKFLKGRINKFCPDCKRRSGKNPLRILDCKKEGCRGLSREAPLVHDFLCEACAQHYREVRGLLLAGHISFKENPRIVRGLDYYCRTAFEVISEGLGAQDAVAAGGRYDGLVKDLGGPDMAGVGFAIGVERLMLLLDRGPWTVDRGPGTTVFFALLGNEAQQKSLAAIQELRTKGNYVECGYGGSLKSQLRRADKLAAKFVVIIGENEIKKDMAIIKEMASGKQEEVLLGRLVEKLA